MRRKGNSSTEKVPMLKFKLLTCLNLISVEGMVAGGFIWLGFFPGPLACWEQLRFCKPATRLCRGCVRIAERGHCCFRSKGETCESHWPKRALTRYPLRP